MGRLTNRRTVLRIEGSHRRRVDDTLVVEEPLELRVAGRSLTVTMRTPGNDFELARGFLTSEGVLHRREDLRTMRYCTGTDEDGRQTYNVIDAVLAAGVDVPEGVERAFTTHSSCGICGKESIDSVRTRSAWTSADDNVVLSPAVLATMPDALRAAQAVFETTGGLHAAGLFTVDGTLVCAREDVGRHNAVDKVIGWAMERGRIPLRAHVLMVSGRASFELVQKASMAGIPALASVSAPSDLAVRLAEESEMTLIGFLRGDRMNVYTRIDRLAK